MKIIAGLGNPEKRYESTRHNVGFCAVDNLATNAGAEFKMVNDFRAAVAKTSLHGHGTLLVKPMTYMNLSGEAIILVMSYFKVDLSDLLVIHDDTAIPLGRISVQQGRGAAGQHGVESIIRSFGGKKEFARIRVGVGPSPPGDRRGDYVLSPVPTVDRELYETVIKKSGEAASSWIDKGLTTTSNFFNGQIYGLPEQLRLEHEKEQERARIKAEQERVKAEHERISADSSTPD